MHSYRIDHLPPFHFSGGKPGKRLEQFLAASRADRILPGSIEIHLGRFRVEKDMYEQSGAYKFIRWRSAVRYQGEELKEIYFHSAGFRSFLLFRLVLLPLFWRQSVRRGGTYLLGTAYREQGKTYLLFAHPGAGKTRFLLERLAQNPEIALIGDGSLLWLPETGLLPILPELELRCKTVKGNPLWRKLPGRMKGYLRFCNLLSLLTGRRISFNAAINPAAYGIPTAADDPATPPEVFEVIHRKPRAMTYEEASAAILQYLEGYHRCYANIFRGEPPLAETRENLSTLLR